MEVVRQPGLFLRLRNFGLTVMPEPKDLFILTADSQLERTLSTLLHHRKPSLNIRDITFEIRRHQNKDPGCRTESASYLRELQGEYSKAMVVFDFRGCGAEDVRPEELEDQLEAEVAGAGWSRADSSVDVIYPELEAWLFAASFQRLQQVLGWPGSQSLNDWFEEKGFLSPGIVKPAHPKVALEILLSELRIPRSSSLFEQIARRQSLVSCQDRSFQKFRNTLQHWFPAVSQKTGAG